MPNTFTIATPIIIRFFFFAHIFPILVPAELVSVIIFRFWLLFAPNLIQI